MTATSSLSINGLRLSVFLGAYAQERSKEQTVILDAKIRFPQPPAACLSDKLAETFCYSKLIGHIKEQLIGQKFQLIEHLTHKMQALIKAYLPADCAVSVRLTKQPRIPDLEQGVTFEYGDGSITW